MQASDDRSLHAPLFGAIAVGACTYATYGLPALAGARARFVSDRSRAWVLDGPVGTALCERLGIEDRTASGRGYALTFDDGPHPDGTPAVLEILARAGVRATFFLVGEQVRRNPALAGEIAAAGHEIGLHCHRHRNLLRLAPRQVRADIDRAQEVIERATARRLTLYRPPYGMLNASALRLARGRGWRTLLWSQWGRDWEARATPESIAARLTDGVEEGSVLLLHDADDYSAPGSWRRTVAALPSVLDLLAERGLESVAP
jgi:peptidoglycan/xylan/chitin deacetylase (PgdA/CDA1 family)